MNLESQVYIDITSRMQKTTTIATTTTQKHSTTQPGIVQPSRRKPMNISAITAATMTIKIAISPMLYPPMKAKSMLHRLSRAKVRKSPNKIRAYFPITLLQNSSHNGPS